MADKIGELYVEIVADNKKFDSGIDQSKKKTEKFKGGLDNLSGTVKKLLGAGALIALAGKIIDIGKASISAASDAQETQNKFDVVFSGISEFANTMAESLAVSYGTSIQGAKDMLAGTGDLLTGLGFTQEGAFDLSQQVLTLGSDLASFTNFSGGAEGASEALTKALLGERESLKALGISINEADLKAEVLRQTEEGLTFETEKQAKANATLTLVMNQSKNAIGDFERSQDSFANQTKIAAAAVDDLQVLMGGLLLPIATKGIGVFGDLTKTVTEHLTALIDARKVYDSFSKGQETVNDKLFVVKRQIAETSVEIDTLEDMYERATDPKFKQKWQDQLVVLYEQNQVSRRIESAIRQEIKAKQDKIDAENEEARLLEEKKKKEKEASDARKQQYVDQNKAVQEILEANRSEIDAIDDKIAEISRLSLAESEYYDDQQEAIRLLQEEKQAILDEDAENRVDELEQQKDYWRTVDQLIADSNAKRAEDEETARAKRMQDLQLEADFILTTAGSIGDIWNNLTEIKINGIEEAMNRDIAALDEQLLGESEYAEQKKAIEVKAKNDEYDIKKAAFETQKKLDITETIISGALGAQRAFTSLAGIPVIGVGLGIAAAATAGIATGVQVGLIASQPAPPRPQLATGAVIAGSARGVDVTVAEGGNGEIIQGMGSQGAALRAQLANETADVLMARGAMGGVTNNFYGKSLLSNSEMADFARQFYPSQVKELQRRGVN